MWLAALAVAAGFRLLTLGKREGIPSWLGEIAKAFLEADAIVDLSGDSYRSRPGGFAPAHDALVLGAWALGTRLALVSQSIGPFSGLWKSVTAIALSKVRVLYLREASSRRVAMDLGVSRERIVDAPDVAFTLRSTTTPRVESLLSRCRSDDSEGPAIGISTNCLMLAFTANRDVYVDQMCRLVEHVRARTGATVVLVPHVVHDARVGSDDRVPGRAIVEAMASPSWLVEIEDDLEPDEIKGLVSTLDAFVAARMHAGIAALSSGVPTMFLSWSHKYRAVLDDMGMAHLTWESRDGTIADLLAKFDSLWEDKEQEAARLRVYTIGAASRIDEALIELRSRLGLLPRHSSSPRPRGPMADSRVEAV